MISLAIVFGIGAIARSTKDQPTTKDTAAPPPTNSPRMSLILVGLILVHCVVAVVICRHWLPMIDTYTFQRDACKNLLQGIDPFGATQADIYGSRYNFYGPGMVVNGRVQVGFQYPPLTLFWALPGYLLGDIRYAYIFAVMLSAWIIFAMVPNQRSLCIAALLLLNPLTFFVEIMSWTEPLVLLTLSATLYAAIKKRWWLPIALGLFLASKQYNVLALPFLAGLIQPLQWKPYGKLLTRALLITAATILPFALWNFHGLWRDLVLFHLAQPFRPQSLSFAVPYPIFLKIGPALLLAFIVWATMNKNTQSGNVRGRLCSVLAAVALHQQAGILQLLFLDRAGVLVGSSGAAQSFITTASTNDRQRIRVYLKREYISHLVARRRTIITHGRFGLRVLGRPRLSSLLKNAPLLLPLGGAAVYRSCTCLWVAQRFTAAIRGLFSMTASAAEGTAAHCMSFSAICLTVPP